MTTSTLPELDADLVERTAKAIGLARINADYPGDPHISADGYAIYWRDTYPEERSRLRAQAVAALRGSQLLEQIDALEARIDAAQRELVIYAGELNSQALAAKVHRVTRVLAKDRPEEEPISIK